jgi:uncharacterized protein YjbI with pentapeptide repeats
MSNAPTQMNPMAPSLQPSASQSNLQMAPSQPPLAPQPEPRTGWTGFAEKTLWDWLNLLGVFLIPLFIGAGTIIITVQQTALSQSQHQNDQQISNDQQQAATLQTYLDDMSELLLNKQLLESRPGDMVRQVARARTLTTLRRLDSVRNIIVLRFLQDAHLIGIQNAVIDLSNADLSNDHLSGTNLSVTDLSSANLSHADLNGANLSHAILNSVTLSNATLKDANLSNTFLNSVILKSADLSNADLSGTDLSNADLSNANLKSTSLNGAIMKYTILIGANLNNADLSGVSSLTQQQLDKVYSCTNAVLSLGLTCHRNQ